MNIIKRIASAAAAAAICMMLSGCPDKNAVGHYVDDEPVSSADTSSAAEELTDEDMQSFKVQFDISVDGESVGSFVITTDPENAPLTCKNFKKLVEEGFYDGLTFHRVMDGFMAQGGDPNGDGTGGLPDKIYGEFKSNGWENDHSHTRGAVSMARSQDPDSASSQFFICYSDDYTDTLDGNYAAFGDVTEGMEVVDSFLDVERTANARGERAVPTVPIVIEKATIIG